MDNQDINAVGTIISENDYSTNMKTAFGIANVMTCSNITVPIINDLPFQQVLGQVVVSSAQPIYISNKDINKIWCLTSGTTVDFIELEHLNEGWVAYVKNCQDHGGGGNSINVLYNNNPISSPTGTSTLYDRPNGGNNPINILYSTGSGLILL